jgi:hypothetical protein
MLTIHGPGFSDDNGRDMVSSDPRPEPEPDALGPGAVAVATIGWCCCTGSTADMVNYDGTMVSRRSSVTGHRLTGETAYHLHEPLRVFVHVCHGWLGLWGHLGRRWWRGGAVHGGDVRARTPRERLHQLRR